MQVLRLNQSARLGPQNGTHNNKPMAVFLSAERKDGSNLSLTACSFICPSPKSSVRSESAWTTILTGKVWSCTRQTVCIAHLEPNRKVIPTYDELPINVRPKDSVHRNPPDPLCSQRSRTVYISSGVTPKYRFPPTISHPGPYRRLGPALIVIAWQLLHVGASLPYCPGFTMSPIPVQTTLLLDPISQFIVSIFSGALAVPNSCLAIYTIVYSIIVCFLNSKLATVNAMDRRVWALQTAGPSAIDFSERIAV